MENGEEGNETTIPKDKKNKKLRNNNKNIVFNVPIGRYTEISEAGLKFWM